MRLKLVQASTYIIPYLGYVTVAFEVTHRQIFQLWILQRGERKGRQSCHHDEKITRGPRRCGSPKDSILDAERGGLLKRRFDRFV